MDTVTLRIDGREIVTEKGKTILQAALDHGISIPYYCYHPGIGVEGSCRVCIVKVEKMPKLQTSCSTVCSDGMVVETRSREVVDARASVFEFLLINHPLDCPVCDKGGECPLQDYSYAFGPDNSRMEFPRRTFDGDGVKADIDFGPTLMLNRNRCILCTRCARFMRDIHGEAQIGIVDRGNRSQISTFQDTGVHSLISGNLMDVCPVGAITTRDYRFKSRPWDNPVVVDTTCTLCAKGCSTTAWIKAKPEWAKGAKLIRMTPRYNADVNGYWMCDIGRFNYHWVEGDDRLTTPLVRQSSGAQAAATWTGALTRLAESVRPVLQSHASAFRVLVSAHASHEELFLIRQLVQSTQGAEAVSRVGVAWTSSAKSQPAHTKFTVPAVDAPNVAGARVFGFAVPTAESAAADVSELRKDVESGAVKALFVLDPGPDGSIGDVAWIIAAKSSGKLAHLIVQGPVRTALTAVADVVLPGAAWTEKDATYTNEAGRLQAASSVMNPPGDARQDWQVLVQVAEALGVSAPFSDSASVRTAIADTMAGVQAVAGIAQVVFTGPQTAQQWLHTSNPSERWKWDHLFHDEAPAKGEPHVVRADLVKK
ncbi:MAG: molybdopterin-dependent oxidoreductase [Acidobacteriota bacterium]